MSNGGEASGDEERREPERAVSGAPAAGWAIGDRFSTNEIFQRLVASADEEVATGTAELLFSGIAAGFAIVLTFVGYAVGSATFPESEFLYPVGLVYIILGRTSSIPKTPSHRWRWC